MNRTLLVLVLVLGLFSITTKSAFAQTFPGPLQVGSTAFTTIAGDNATSSFTNGIDLPDGGCFSILGVCLSTSFITIGSPGILIGDDNAGIGQLVIGNTAFDSFSGGDANTAIGNQALNHFITGNGDVALGRAAGYAFQSGDGNLMLGTGVGKSFAGLSGNWTGNYNTFVGDGSADDIADGATISSDIIIGDNAADDQELTGGTNNILIGASMNLPTDSGSYQLDIGNLIYGSNISGTLYGVSPGTIGIGTTSPSARFAIQANNGETNPLLFVIASSSQTLYTINNVGHHLFDGSLPTISSCGAGATNKGSDDRGRITMGTGSITACTLTFANAWDRAPICTVNQETGTLVTVAANPTKTAIVFRSSGSISGDVIDYSCDGY